jgi:hypothetical protein
VTVVETGYFRTEFLVGNSAVYASKMIDDYDATSGATRRSTASRPTIRRSSDHDRPVGKSIRSS